MFTVYLGPWRRVVVLVGHEAVQEALGGQAEEFSGRGTVATLDLPVAMSTAKVTDELGLLSLSSGTLVRQWRRTELLSHLG